MQRSSFAGGIVGLTLATCLTLLPVISAQDAPPSKKKNKKPAAAKALNDKELYKALLPSVAWVRTSPGNDAGAGMGTGFVVDVDRCLVVTNEHVVKGFSERGYDEMIVHFAEQDAEGRTIVEPLHYVKQPDALKGEVIHRDVARDLALIRLPSLPASARALKFADHLPEPGEHVISIAGKPEGSEGVWIMSTGSVRMSYRRSHANGAVAGVVESDMPTNRGNSGGPIVNDRNELVAVCEGHRLDARLVSMYIDVNEVRAFLEVCEPLIEPQDAQAFFDRGYYRHNTKRWEAALKDYNEALRLDPKMALASVNKGWIFNSMQDYATAEAEFDAALKIDPENASGYEGRGVCRRSLGRNDEAIADFTQAIRRSPDEAHLYFRRTIAHRNKNDLPAALADLNRCVALDPNTADNYGSRGQVHRLLKNFKESLADFDMTLKLQPQNPAWWYEAARVHYDQENYAASINLNSVAIQLNNQTTSYFNDRGLAYYHLERYNEAIADFQAAFKINPKGAKYLESIGDCLWYSNKFRESWDLYNQAVVLDPSRASAWRSRGDVYKHFGDTAAAQRDYAKARELEGK
ncbi:Putative serine protease HtrA [Anatilimnocola aggregata]|uniref:Serine protease HtrA n=1 Tax=Anatilimnocola aggregata TaxID=2528021 RepID=A0A517Y866_9BACT|nr:tetratricopeptide repeat-containing serine protease family protein [Anatilimnocola aggregata]QDU26430.1 Putative serine protease HtrA [Anatilimnocola aggregata]